MKNKETVEEAAQKLQKDKYGVFISKDADVKGQLVIDTAKAAFLSGMKEGAKWQQERMYSEEDLREAYIAGCKNPLLYKTHEEKAIDWYKQYKK